MNEYSYFYSRGGDLISTQCEGICGDSSSITSLTCCGPMLHRKWFQHLFRAPPQHPPPVFWFISFLGHHDNWAAMTDSKGDSISSGSHKQKEVFITSKKKKIGTTATTVIVEAPHICMYGLLPRSQDAHKGSTIKPDQQCSMIGKMDCVLVKWLEMSQRTNQRMSKSANITAPYKPGKFEACIK